ncbi:HipA family kinase [Mesobacillus maritimus]|uniref:HipA family kinase n=1 Tax=Mesobacillus maritimus TaxID=1643336 RepID=UPI00384D421B
MIEPVAYHKKLEGKSNARLITFSDGNDYVVKFFQPGFEKTLPNEWIGYCLARYLQMPVPYGRIVDIPSDFFKNVQDQKKGEGATEVPDFSQLSDVPYQFASLYVADCVNGHEVADINTITNSASLANIILFDYWVGNQDRTRKNILFQAQEQAQGQDQDQDQGIYHLWIIDHAEILGGFNWQLADLEGLSDGIVKSMAHKIMASFIESEEEFYKQLEVIQTIPILLIEEIVTLIPDEWGVSKEERKAIVTSLLYRRHKVLPKLIERFIKKVYQPLKTENG